ncbi:MAG: pyruvate:ferredoxin (flavodoxin) oxidoreductase [Planctomycetaceae bacterium]|nr:MAG: pyruvate:ferredoxin (flavodoxin) oxidoreductase [Planctomycetaceae bacterium]
MNKRKWVTVDGNEAAGYVAHKCSEVVAIYPITPSSPMGELSDAWAAAGYPNVFGAIPDVIEMQSEGGAAGACHGAIQAGALTTTFTASQGLLLMIPNMFKIAGELTPAVFHVSARTLATHALSIFGDHSDVMSVRSCGWAMLASGSVVEAQDMAMIAHSATFRTRIPFLHFFDGFRTSHEVNKIELLTDDDIRSMLDDELIAEHRMRALDPDRPKIRGTAQNPDVFFQAREACNRFYDATPGIVQETMDRFAELTGRQYHLFDYVGAPDAQRVVILMGSGIGAAEEAVHQMVEAGEKVGMVIVRLFRPFDVSAFINTLPSSVKHIAVLDRTKEPGATGEPLYQDVVTAVMESWADRPETNGSMPKIIAGRYGLSSKEFTPAMVKAVFDQMSVDAPKKRFTVGIIDDVTNLSIRWDPEVYSENADVNCSIFYGLGSDGTVGANKNTVKIIGENTDLFAQGYFVYDSKKAGAMTVSHLRFSPRPINSTYLIERASFVACHQPVFLERMDVLEKAEKGATFLLNSPHGPDQIWSHLPFELQQTIIDKQLKFYVIDALTVAREAGMGGRINTVMQTCFFALANVLPRDAAIAQIKEAIEKTYGKRGESIVQRNFAAVDASIANLHEVQVPSVADSQLRLLPPVTGSITDFVERVTSTIVAGKGDLLPVSAMPIDGTFPTATAQYEKRSIAVEIPIWDAEICIQCGLCALVCPHAAIRAKAFPEADGAGAPEGFVSRKYTGKDLPDHLFTIQVAPDDCTGCGVCVDVCPAKSKTEVKHKAINMEHKLDHLDLERKNFDFFLSIPELDRAQVNQQTVKGSQLLLPLFEYSGACSGCGETPYIKLMSQLFGDRVVAANATGCSSIYGGNLPTTPYTVTAEGRGPAWCNSLFEDNAEFGLGYRLALDMRKHFAETLLKTLAGQIGEDLVGELLNATQDAEEEIFAQRRRIDALMKRLESMSGPEVVRLRAVADALARKSVWIIGGDGWAYDIGFGGLDHVCALGRDVNILVLDTGVYSNTGGQASKATPRGAVAKFAAAGKSVNKKDLGMIAASYGNVYVGQVAMGANPAQTVKVFREAESWRGPSLILAYSHCIAHGIEMSTAMTHQKDVVRSGFWPLYRFDPRLARDGGRPFQLDSRKPTIPFRELAVKEARFAMLLRSNPERADHLFKLAQQDIDDLWHYYEQLAGVERDIAGSNGGK